MEEKNWILGSLNISQDWQKPGIYRGSINFKNNIKLDFNMLLDADKCAKIIAILRDEIIESAKTVGDQLIKSMPTALPPVRNDGIEDVKEIGA